MFDGSRTGHSSPINCEAGIDPSYSFFLWKLIAGTAVMRLLSRQLLYIMQLELECFAALSFLLLFCLHLLLLARVQRLSTTSC